MRISIALFVILSACTPAPDLSAAACVPDDCGYIEGAQFLIGPATDPTRACGLPREYKVGARIDPPTSAAAGRWQIKGCYYAHNLELRQVALALAFDSEPRVKVVHLTDFVPANSRENTFDLIVQRPNDDPVKGAYLTLQWRTKH